MFTEIENEEFPAGVGMQMKGASGHRGKRTLSRTAASDVEGLVRVQQQAHANMEKANRIAGEGLAIDIRQQQEMINLAIAESIGNITAGRGVGAPDAMMPSSITSDTDALSRLRARLDQLVAPHVQEDVEAMRQLRRHGRELGDRIDALASEAAALTEELERALER